MALVIPRGSGDDPATGHGLASLTGDMIDEGAGDLDAIGLSDALAKLGTQLDIDVGADATVISVTALVRQLEPSLKVLADVVSRPRLVDADFQRVRDLRLSRLRQMSQSSGAQADRAYMTAVFGAHPYGHGSMGTTATLSRLAVEDVRAFWAQRYRPETAVLIVGGAIAHDPVLAACDAAFRGWAAPSPQDPPAVVEAAPPPDRAVLLVDRAGAPQSELRIGHLGPARRTDGYHSLVTTNALLGGQFTSRINRILREEKGVTYGARTSFDFRRDSGTFSCETSVQSDRTGESVEDVLAEFARIGERPVPADELERGKGSLTRGFVRQFETPGQIVRAATQLAVHGLDDDEFDRFVPGVEAVTDEDVATSARTFIRAGEATIVVAGDAALCEPQLSRLGRPVRVVTPEF